MAGIDVLIVYGKTCTVRSSNTLTEQVIFTTPEEEFKASWDYSSHHSSTINKYSEQVQFIHEQLSS